MNFIPETKMTLNPDTMNRLAIFSFAMLLSLSALAQTVKVNAKSNRIKGNACAGFSLDLEGKADDAENSLIKFLKDYGKPRSTTDYVSVTGPTLGGSFYDGKTLYATITGDDKKAQAWLGIDTAEWKTSSSSVFERIEKMTYQFGVTFYKEQIQKEVDETQRAFDATEKQKLRLSNQVKDLNLKLSNNEQEKLHLEKSLEANSLEHAVILQKLENNKKSQDSISSAGLQIKKMLDAKKEKQKKVN
jgi:hypothetical protein